MPPRPSESKTPLSLRQELLGRPSTSVLAFAMLNAAAFSAEAATPPEATPTSSPRDAAAKAASDDSLEWMSKIIIEGSADTYKPELASNPKRPEALLNTPQSISVVPREVIRDQNATNLRDILRNVPGITIPGGRRRREPRATILSSGVSPRARTSTWTARATSTASTAIPFNIEQVEVTKGPASVYTGRGSTGGSINVITKTPGQDPFYALNAGIGTDDYTRETLDINQPFRLGWGQQDTSKDGADNKPTAAFRLNALWHTQDVPGRDEASYQRWGVAPSLAFGLGTTTQLSIQYMHLDQNNMPDFGVPWITATNVPLAGFRNQPAPVDFSNYYGLNQRDHEFLRTDEIIASLEHNFNEALDLRYTFHAGRNYRDSIISAPRFISNTSTDINREFQSRDESDDVLTKPT